MVEIHAALQVLNDFSSHCNSRFAVMLQPFSGGAPTAETSKHKFLVQTCYVPQGENNIEQIVSRLLVHLIAIDSLM